MIEHRILADPVTADVLARRRGGSVDISGSIGFIVLVVVLAVLVALVRLAWQHRARIAMFVQQLQTRAQDSARTNHPTPPHYSGPPAPGQVQPTFGPPPRLSPPPGVPVPHPYAAAVVPPPPPPPVGRVSAPGDIRAARDPRTPGHVLVHMANNAPDLRPHLLANPALEPGLRHWLSQQ